MRIALMAHIKYQAVFIRVEDPVNGYNQFYCSQAGSQMAAGAGYRINEPGPQQFTQRRRLTIAQAAQVIGNMV